MAHDENIEHHRDIVEAVHKLEVSMLKQMGDHSALMQVNNDRMEHLRVAVDRHREILFGNDEGDAMGLVSKMHDIEKDERERRLTLRGVTVAFVGVLGKMFWDFFKN